LSKILLFIAHQKQLIVIIVGQTKSVYINDYQLSSKLMIPELELSQYQMLIQMILQKQ